MSTTNVNTVAAPKPSVTVGTGSTNPAAGTKIYLTDYTLRGTTESPVTSNQLPKGAVINVVSAGAVPGIGTSQSWTYPFNVTTDQPIQVGSGSVEDE